MILFQVNRKRFRFQISFLDQPLASSCTLDLASRIPASLDLLLVNSHSLLVLKVAYSATESALTNFYCLGHILLVLCQHYPNKLNWRFILFGKQVPPYMSSLPGSQMVDIILCSTSMHRHNR